MPLRPRSPAIAAMLSRRHLTRLRQMYRSAGWPCQDQLEIDLLAAGLLQLQTDSLGRDTLRLTPEGIAALAHYGESNRQLRTPHEALVEQVALHMQRQGRIVWRGLALRASINHGTDDEPQPGWVMAMPDVYSVRNTTVEGYLEPIVHEIKVSRADLLGDVRNPAKRAAYLAMAPQVYYVLGCNAKGKPIGGAEDVPPECGVIVATASGLEVLRPAPQRPFEAMRFDMWMALAKASPLPRPEDGEEQLAF